METNLSKEEIATQQEDEKVMKEMLPYFGYALVPLIITIIIAMTFAPNMTLP